MHHNPSHHHTHVSACTPADGRSPLQALEESFLALAAAPEPLTLPAHLVCEEPEQPVLPVDQVRTHLAHPGMSPALRERTWGEVVRRARRLGAPWDTVALGMAVPVLHRMLTRVGRCEHVERAEVEQEALAAVTAALYTVDADGSSAGWELFAAADRAVHRLVYAARRRAQRETRPQEASLSRLDHGGDPAASPTLGLEAQSDEAKDEYTVLALAVRAHVVTIDEAQLIARTRLEGEPMQRLAAERGVSCRQLYRHRAAAEQHLAAHLRHQLHQG
ncbi:ECF-type sigma factor [Streptomyces noursei]|uniref:ECF-type sigma factor n=1 Tax=Streptomyces noursei TaxID=1971 RepID=UPI00167857C2|nr:ECF-type sigma factor [Streptomyces noursei]MCZ1014797.1 ECF-type sigma factor [Streptomyces noursei]GGW97732.1 hypothetical protein GCM10010341_19060 [Streptomyces noursei]